MDKKIITVSRFINEQEHLHSDATGSLSVILYNLFLASKVIWREVSKAGLVNILGTTASTNIQGEVQQKLDVFANEAIIKFTRHSGEICVLASEEELIRTEEHYRMDNDEDIKLWQVGGIRSEDAADDN